MKALELSSKDISPLSWQFMLRDKTIFRDSRKWQQGVSSSILHHSISKTHLKLIFYWGCGTRDTLTKAEFDALDFQYAWANKIASYAELKLQRAVVFTDTHAAINAKPKETVKRYFCAVEQICKDRDINAFYMKDLLLRSGFDDFMDCAETIKNTVWDTFSESFKKSLIYTASLHSNDLPPQEAAKLYCALNMIESAVVQEHFLDSFFASYDLPTHECLLPSLPTFFAYPTADMNVRRPWFRRF